MGTVSVLTTVNAPHSKQLDADELAYCLKDYAAAVEMPGHLSSFFGEVLPAAQKEFAAAHGISVAELKQAAQDFAAFSGESYPPIV